MKIKAPSFADLFAETSPQLGGARRTKFLETLDRIIPWQDLKALIGPYYSEVKRGAQPYPLELIIRIHFRIAFFVGVFRRTRRFNKRAVNNRALAEQKPPGGKLLLEQIKDLFVRTVFLKEMTEAQNRSLIGTF